MDGQGHENITNKLAGGLSLIVFGLVMLMIAWSYPAGTITQMGYGFMPRAMAIAITLFGVVILISDLRNTDTAQSDTTQWRSLLMVGASVIMFVVLIEPAGLVPAMFCAVAISKLANRHSSLKSILIYSVIATAAGWLLFIVALGLPISVFGR